MEIATKYFLLQKITSDEYVERITKSVSAKGSIASKFMSLYADYSKNIVTEIKYIFLTFSIVEIRK